MPPHKRLVQPRFLPSENEIGDAVYRFDDEAHERFLRVLRRVGALPCVLVRPESGATFGQTVTQDLVGCTRYVLLLGQQIH